MGYPRKREDGRWEKPCHLCGVMQDYSRGCYARESLRNKKKCRKCFYKSMEGKKPTHHNGWHRGVLRKSLHERIKHGAVTRGLDWKVKPDSLATLLIKQCFRCALTGWEISAMEVAGATASLDRIDSSKGYIEGNIQWVHVMVNMCKQSYDQENFIFMCKAIADNGD